MKRPACEGAGVFFGFLLQWFSRATLRWRGSRGMPGVRVTVSWFSSYNGGLKSDEGNE
jgi:hypothetical protein